MTTLVPLIYHWDVRGLLGFVCCHCALRTDRWAWPLSVCCFCISLPTAGRWTLVCGGGNALVEVRVSVLYVFQFLMYAGCTRGFVGGGWSPWMRMLFGVVGVTALGWALGLQCRHGTS